MSPTARARFKVGYLLAISVAVFSTSNPWLLASLALLQLLLWIAARLELRALGKALRKLAPFLILIVVCYTLLGGSDGDRFVSLPLGILPALHLSIDALLLSLQRASRILTIIVAAQVVQRSGPPGQLAAGLKAFGMPLSLSAGLDLALAMLGDEAPGRRKKKGEKSSRGMRSILKGDLGFLTEAIDRRIAAVRKALPAELDRNRSHDVAVGAALAIVAMSLRFLKVMPGLPIAPGHKGVLIIPLYLLAHRWGRGRWTSTQFGALVGILSFLFGMGKFGPFEILRHVVPGLFTDLVGPLIGLRHRSHRAWVYGLFAIGVALTRLSSMLFIAWATQAPPAVYALLLPTSIAHAVFGFLSGAVTVRLLSRSSGGGGQEDPTD